MLSISWLSLALMIMTSLGSTRITFLLILFSIMIKIQVHILLLLLCLFSAESNSDHWDHVTPGKKLLRIVEITWDKSVTIQRPAVINVLINGSISNVFILLFVGTVNYWNSLWGLIIIPIQYFDRVATMVYKVQSKSKIIAFIFSMNPVAVLNCRYYFSQ